MSVIYQLVKAGWLDPEGLLGLLWLRKWRWDGWIFKSFSSKDDFEKVKVRLMDSQSVWLRKWDDMILKKLHLFIMVLIEKGKVRWFYPRRGSPVKTSNSNCWHPGGQNRPPHFSLKSIKKSKYYRSLQKTHNISHVGQEWTKAPSTLPSI